MDEVIKIESLMLITVLFFCACSKKTVTPDYSTLIVGKWICSSYQDDGDTLVKRKPYSISVRYETGWQFSVNKQLLYRSNGGDWLSFEKDYYLLVDNTKLILNRDDGNSGFSASNFRIIELSKDKLTVHGEDWKSTFFLTKEQ